MGEGRREGVEGEVEMGKGENRITLDAPEKNLRLHDVVRLLDYRFVVLSNSDVVPPHRERLDLFLEKLWIVHVDHRYHERPVLLRIVNREHIVGLEDAIEDLEG